MHYARGFHVLASIRPTVQPDDGAQDEKPDRVAAKRISGPVRPELDASVAHEADHEDEGGLDEAPEPSLRDTGLRTIDQKSVEQRGAENVAAGEAGVTQLVDDVHE